MGFFDRFSGKKPLASSPPPVNPLAPATSEVSPSPQPGLPTPPASVAGGVIPRLAAAREKLEQKDLPGALAIYEEVLATAGDRADVLVTVSGDLGSNGHVAPIVELVAPRYDALRHGPATGLNLLQAYLAVRNPDAAQHVLDILFSLHRPELEERLYGFSNAIADLLAIPALSSETALGAASEIPKIALVSISKPIWFYGLEELTPPLFPAKEGRLRRVAFAQLALPGYPDLPAAMKMPEDELGRLSRALPLWLAETFHFAPHYAPIAAVGLLDDPTAGKHYALFGAEWSTENLQQLIDTTQDGLDYVFTGALRQVAGDCELLLRVFEVKKFRERKTFTARWTPSQADAELARLHEQIRSFMEWTPATSGLTYAAPTQPRAWLDTLGYSLASFLAEKGLLPKDQVVMPAAALAHAAQYAGTNETASLAFLGLRARMVKLGLAATLEAPLVNTPLVEQARQTLS